MQLVSSPSEILGRRVHVSTYHHAKLDLLSAVLLLDGLVQDDVQEDVVAAQDADDLATAVELDKQPLIEVLQQAGVSRRASNGERREQGRSDEHLQAPKGTVGAAAGQHQPWFRYPEGQANAPS